jgi:hypothetical protein
VTPDDVQRLAHQTCRTADATLVALGPTKGVNLQLADLDF